MHSELFEFYTPTKDRLSKPMPQWIFHSEREGEPGRIKERRGGEKKQEAERHRERRGERARERQRSDAGSQENISCTV